MHVKNMCGPNILFVFIDWNCIHELYYKRTLVEIYIIIWVAEYDLYNVINPWFEPHERHCAVSLNKIDSLS